MNLVAFYRGEGSDYQGRLLRELWAFNRQELEEHHDFIQVLFPLPEPSGFHWQAPLLDSSTLAEFRRQPLLQQNLLKSLEVMLAFYGFRLDRDKKIITPADNFKECADNWLFPHDHNHRRITRILRCLTLCGLEDYARAFYTALVQVAGPTTVTAETLEFWENAVR
jgi:hypothetical protein